MFKTVPPTEYLHECREAMFIGIVGHLHVFEKWKTGPLDLKAFPYHFLGRSLNIFKRPMYNGERDYLMGILSQCSLLLIAQSSVKIGHITEFLFVLNRSLIWHFKKLINFFKFGGLENRSDPFLRYT